MKVDRGGRHREKMPAIRDPVDCPGRKRWESMGVLFVKFRPVLCMLAALGGLFALGGCQLKPSIPAARLIRHQAMVDPAGLSDSSTVGELKVHIAAPQKWEPLTLAKHPMYINTQWRSPSRTTGVGVAYVRLPVPLPAKAIAWLAQKEYAKRADDGKILDTWEDGLGRPWFEAQNTRYHIRGYVVSKGFEAWIIYCGYKREQPPSSAELTVAGRSLDTIVPTPFAPNIPQRPVAESARTARDRG